MTHTEAPSFHSSESFPLISNDNPTPQNDDVEVEDDDDFEFSFTKLPDFSPVSADDIFLNGQIKPTNPLFHQNAVVETPEAPKRLPLKKLMLEERPTAVTVVNEFDSIDAGSYCVWTPQHKKTSEAPKRWKFRNLLRRSHIGNGGAAAKFVGFFSKANAVGRSNLRPRTK